MFSSEKPLPKPLYVLGVAVIFLAVYSQYFIDFSAIAGGTYATAIGFLVVYGIPILVVSSFFGRQLLQRAAKNNKTAIKYGLGAFGALTVLGIFLEVVALSIILIFQPQAANLLNRPNPVLEVPPNVALIMIAVSFLIVGPAEEYLFRGFMYGGLLNITKGKHWFPLAVASSLLFASVHAYYAVTYGVASALPFISLIVFGIAMCVTYYWSNGNILMLAIIHGAFDATGFLGVATTNEIGIAARFIMIGIGLVFAFIYLPKKMGRISRLLGGSPKPSEPQAPPPPPPVGTPVASQERFFCSYCGAPNGPSDSFCLKCGAPLGKEPPEKEPLS